MAQDFTNGGEQETTERAGGTPTSVDPDNGSATNIVSAGAPQEPLTVEELLRLMEERKEELRAQGVTRNDNTAAGVELRQLEMQTYAMTEGGYPVSFPDYYDEAANSGILGRLMPVAPFDTLTPAEQQMAMGMYEGRYYNEAVGTPLDVLNQELEELGVPTWALPLLTRKPVNLGRGGRGDRTNGRDRDGRTPCPRRR